MKRLAWLLPAVVLFSAEPLPEDRGAAGLHQALKRLGTSARVLYITAHPDDEDGGTITWLTRGLGVDVTLLSLTRGEAGANLVTADFFDSLGALRTLELAKAAQYYGARLRFTTFADYGYSKNVAEAWRNWDRDKLLAEAVRVVREEKPHVILVRWQGTPRDGHGHHEAAGVIARQAWEVAGDPMRFPEAGEAWQAIKFYSNNRRETDDWTVRIDSGLYDPMLGRSYAQIARDGLRWQRSQGAGSVVSRPGPQVSYYKLVGSTVGLADKEAGFFERLEEMIRPPVDLPAEPDSEDLAAGLRRVRELNDERKARQFEQALTLKLGLELEALVQPDGPLPAPLLAFRPYETFQLAVPGQRFEVAATFHNRTRSPVSLGRVELAAPPGWEIRSQAENRFEVRVADEAGYTKAFWRRDSVRELQYRVEDASLWGQALPPAPLVARATYRIHGVDAAVERVVMVSRIDAIGVQHLQRLQVGPAVSVRFASEYGVMPLEQRGYDLVCVVRNLGRTPEQGTVKLELPAGWRSEPEQAEFALSRENQEANLGFRLKAPDGAEATEYAVRAVARAGGRIYASGFVPHTYPGLDTLWMERAAVHRVRRVEVKVAPGLTVGYVMGTGDDVPATLRQLGVEVEMLDTAMLARGHLSRYDAILLGIRAYAAREDVKVYNARLLEYVENGGTLVVQYNTPEFDNNYGPYPYRMGRNPEEVSEENSAVKILDPEDPVFHFPNRITAADFAGWVEQRGSKFLAGWDPRYKALLETADTGQAPQRGGWLSARYGKGLYVYCAYAWYRQLPFAVPGAVRLFANLVSQKSGQQ